MPRLKSITVVDRKIAKVQSDLVKTKAKYDRLTAELHALERERKQCQADALMDALSKSGKTLDDVLIFLGR